MINPFFNYKKYDTYLSIYPDARMKDRPLVNSSWELVLNLKDEEVNLDISRDGIQDIVLYVFYDDFSML